MNLPFFYTERIGGDEKVITIDEANSKHIVNVLRMKTGDDIMLTDGKGKKAYAKIADDNKKKCKVELIRTEQEKQRIPKVVIGISLLKNTSRFEWFLEKATEIGIHSIIPLICNRTQSEKFRPDRMQTILISALLQSQQSWLPVLHEPIPIENAIKSFSYPNKYIAHCLHGERTSLISFRNSEDSIILIGPEGDFSENEIKSALDSGFKAVTLGENRLRTETAGIVSAVLLRLL